MRLKIALVIGCLALVLGASPAFAKAKPNPPPPTIKTFAGTFAGGGTEQSLNCFWDPNGSPGATPWGAGWYFSDEVLQNVAFVKASTLGNGAISWGGSVFGVMHWTFTTGDGKGTLYGRMVVDFTPTFPFHGQVSGGTGKFAGVTGGFITLDRLPFEPPPPCVGVDNTLNGQYPDTSVAWPAGTPPQTSPLSSIVQNGWIFGDLLYT